MRGAVVFNQIFPFDEPKILLGTTGNIEKYRFRSRITIKIMNKLVFSLGTFLIFTLFITFLCEAQPGLPGSQPGVQPLQPGQPIPGRPFFQRRMMPPAGYLPDYAVHPNYAMQPQATVIHAVDAPWTQHLIKNEDRSHDFKNVAKGSKSVHQFIIKNPFQETVHIASVSSSCTCTVVEILDDKDSLQTYEETAIVAHFMTDRYDGHKNATITVVIDRPNRAVLQLNVQGEIRSDISMPNLISLGPVPDGKEVSRTFTVEYTGPKSDWRIVDLKSDNEHLTGEIVDTTPGRGKITTKIKITLDEKAKPGALFEQFRLVSNDAENRREIPIVVRGTIGKTITISPPTVFLGFLEPGKVSPVRTVSLRGTKPFKITKLLCNNPEVQINFNPSENETPQTVYALPIRYTNPKDGDSAPKDGEMKAIVQIETDDPDLKPTFNVTMKLKEKEN